MPSQDESSSLTEGGVFRRLLLNFFAWTTIAATSILFSIPAWFICSRMLILWVPEDSIAYYQWKAHFFQLVSPLTVLVAFSIFRSRSTRANHHS